MSAVFHFILPGGASGHACKILHRHMTEGETCSGFMNNTTCPRCLEAIGASSKVNKPIKSWKL